jgi:dTMP kinase
LYLKIDVSTLIRRAIARGAIDYFEAGMDMALGDDPYDSFKRYQSLLIREYNRLAAEFRFRTFSARWRPERIQRELQKAVADLFAHRNFAGSLRHNDEPMEPVAPRSVS